MLGLCQAQSSEPFQHLESSDLNLKTGMDLGVSPASSSSGPTGTPTSSIGPLRTQGWGLSPAYLELPPCVELLQTFHSLLSVHHRGHRGALLLGEGKSQGSEDL